MSTIGHDHTALIVVEMQNGFCHDDGSISRLGRDIGMCKQATPGCRRLVDGAHESGVPVIYLQAGLRADYADGGPLVDDLNPGMKDNQVLVRDTWDTALIHELTPEPRDHVVQKNRFSGFYASQLESILMALRTRTLVICGVTTAVCVESTVRDAAQRSYRCFVARDAVGEVDRDMHDASLRVMAYQFARIVDVDDALADWSTRDVAVV